MTVRHAYFRRKLANPIMPKAGPGAAATLRSLDDCARLVGSLYTWRQARPYWEYCAELILAAPRPDAAPMSMLPVRRWNARCAVKGGCDRDDPRSGLCLLAMLPCFMTDQTTVATILEFLTVAESWIPPHARQCTADDIEFHSLKLLQHLANASCKPVTLWPSHNYGRRWAGREAWVTHGDGRTR
jgi:hypothetical protein